ncbi:MAG: hypothetical protein JSU83_22900 [Deltaproteobacteria bacterium]|nr:MAG: hypothetical protein JSU83_22900 [Deltaproteobacteria bacterium]
MLHEVPAALEAMLNERQVRVIVFASTIEKYFSTGVDLRVFDGFGAKEMAEWVSICHGCGKDAPVQQTAAGSHSGNGGGRRHAI